MDLPFTKMEKAEGNAGPWVKLKLTVRHPRGVLNGQLDI